MAPRRTETHARSRALQALYAWDMRGQQNLERVAESYDFTEGRPQWFGRIALENGLRISEAYVGWTEWATEHVDDPTGDARSATRSARGGA